MLESFFRKVVDAVHNVNDKRLGEALRNVNLPLHVRKSFEGPVGSAKMMHVNEALMIEAFRIQAWKSLELSVDTPWPPFSGQLLYGDLSSEVHLPPLNEVFLQDSDKSSPFALFFVAVARLLKKKVSYFSERNAAFAEEKMKSSKPE